MQAVTRSKAMECVWGLGYVSSCTRFLRALYSHQLFSDFDGYYLTVLKHRRLKQWC